MIAALVREGEAFSFDTKSEIIRIRDPRSEFFSHRCPESVFGSQDYFSENASCNRQGLMTVPSDRRVLCELQAAALPKLAHLSATQGIKC